MANGKEGAINTKISVHDFYFSTPLYEVVDEESIEGSVVKGDVDAYSTKYKSPTTYKISRDAMDPYGTSLWGGYLKISLENKRREDDILRFFVLRLENGFVKVGQIPTLANLQYTELDEKYTKYVDKGELILLKKAIGLAAHGVGAGSFVYLRKIFEKQISDTYEANKDKVALKVSQFDQLRMTEKVDKLAEHLPSQLVEMKDIYKILSSGVHQMEEADCLKYFNIMKLSVELIMQQKVELAIKQEKDKLVQQQIAQIKQELKQ